MKKTAIITLAGSATRFCRSAGVECHKSLYHDEGSDWTILGHHLELLERSGFNDIILVVGYRAEDVTAYVQQHFPHLPVRFYHNAHYSDYGTCYSLVVGIEQIPDDCAEVTFLEGDLIFDDAAFQRIVETPGDAITASNFIVDARTSVAFYITTDGKLQYIYDTQHRQLSIPCPFTKIGNSGQVWKFANPQRLKAAIAGYTEVEYKGTNLLPIMKYYEGTDANSIDVVTFSAWFNCNTVQDYRMMRDYIKG